jgi:hypothetical protein
MPNSYEGGTFLMRDYILSLEKKLKRPTSRNVGKAELRRGKHLPWTEADHQGLMAHSTPYVSQCLAQYDT